MVVVTAVTAVAVVARAHAATAVVTVAAKAVVPTAAANSSLHGRKAHARPRAKAVAVVPAWASLLVLPTNPVHRAHLPVSLIRCAPASI